jgi:hypothetical protein
MQKLTITIALAVMALALGTASITTTMQIQPAYSQAQHCTTEGTISRCVTPGQNPSFSICIGGTCLPPNDIPHQQAGRLIGGCHSGPAGCTVTPP